MDEYINVLAAWILIFSVALTVVSAVAYMRTRNARVLFVSLAFVLFTIKGLMLTLSLMYEWADETYLAASVVLDTLIIVLLALTVLKR